MLRISRWRLILVAGVALFCTACGRKRLDDFSEGTGELQGTQADDASGQRISEMLALDEDTWQTQVICGGQAVQIDAKVTVPDVDFMPVVALEKQNMDSDYKKSMLSKLCNQPYVLDEMDPPQWYVDENMERLEDVEKSYNAGAYDSEDEDYAKHELAVLNAWRQRDESKFQDKVSETYEELDFYGEYNERIYRYMFAGVGEDGITPDNFMSWAPVDYEGLSHLEADGGKIGYSAIDREDVTGENHCELSVEAAEKLAEDFLYDLGYTGLACGRVSPLEWYINDKQEDFSLIDGYEFGFYRQINGIMIKEDYTGYNVYFCLKHKNYEEPKLECYKVAVTDAGVIAGIIQNPCVEQEVLSEQTRLLSYQQVKDVFSSLLSEDSFYSQTAEHTTKLNSLKLTYYRQETDNACALIPVWKLENLNNYLYNIDTQEYENVNNKGYIMINAIDGSVIDLGD